MGFLEERFAKNDHAKWHPKSEEIDQVLAVCAGAKPAATINMSADHEFTEYELSEFAKSKGCKLFLHAVPQIVEHEREGYDVTLPDLNIRKALFIYRDDSARDEYIELLRKTYIDAIDDSEYHRRFGKLMGYRDEEIESFVARREAMPRNPKHILQVMNVKEYVELHARPAVYDMLAKDPVWAGILPPRQVVQISPD